MGQEAIQTDDAALGDDIPPFRLRTAHFFVVTTLCAIVVAIRLNWIDWDKVPNDGVEVVRFYQVLASLLFGAAFTALLILFGRRWRFNRSEFQSPGHWLLVFVAVAALISGITEVLLLLYPHYSDSSNVSFDVWNLEKLLMCSGIGIACFVFAWLMSGNLWWKSILALPGIVLLALVPQHLLVLKQAYSNTN